MKDIGYDECSSLVLKVVEQHKKEGRKRWSFGYQSING
jgi:hypothetical protein